MTDIRRIYIANTIRSVANSFIAVYIPAYLLTLGYPLSRVIVYYIINHGFGLLFGLLIITRLINRWGLVKTFRLYYPLEVGSFFLLFVLQRHSFPIELLALLSGAATFSYWMPLNLLFIKHADHQAMGSHLSNFFALPKFFGIFGPLIGALLVTQVGFWPVFAISVIGMLFSFYPLIGISHPFVVAPLRLGQAWATIKRKKLLFVLEGFDNIIEEAEWFWAIYIFMVIGTLSTPGVIGSLEKLGGVFLTIMSGKIAKNNAKKVVPLVSLVMVIITVGKMSVSEPLPAYIITVASSFIFTLFLVSYFSTIYKTIKGPQEEEFIVLREIPTVLGRMVVFGFILLFLDNLRYFFVLPLFVAILIMVVFIKKRSSLAD